MKHKKYWLKSVLISLIVPVIFFIYAIVKVEKGFEGFAYLLTAEVAIVSVILAAIIGLIYGTIKNRNKVL